MKRIAITGGKGTIGAAVGDKLPGLDVRILDLPEVDVRDDHGLDAHLNGVNAVVHLAHQPGENMRSDSINVDNTRMVANVYASALRVGVGRVVMASSVHSDTCVPLPSGLLTTVGPPTPDSPYGANKVFAEALGRHYASRGIEVITIRFGAVNKLDAPPRDNDIERRVWFEPSGLCLPHSVLHRESDSARQLRLHLRDLGESGPFP